MNIDKDEIYEITASLGLLDNLTIEKACSEKGQACLIGNVEICGKKLNLRIIFDDRFPNEAPVIQLRGAENMDIIPHVSRKGEVCFLERDVSIVDPSRPKDIVAASLQMSFATLERGLKGETKTDFFEELEAYFRDMPGVLVYDSIVYEPSRPKLHKLARWNDERMLGVSKEQLQAYLRRSQSSLFTQADYSQVLFVPLRQGSERWIPLPSWKEFWSLPQVREIYLKAGDQGARFFCNQLMRKHNRLPVVFSLPLSSGNTVFFGIGFSNCDGKKHPILNAKSHGAPTPILINRMDKDYLTVRGGASASLSEKKVAVVGCGAIGSHVAIMLAHSGILDLTLIDPQTLSKDNQYRHVLGNDCIGKPKVEGLKLEIERKLPLINAVAQAFTFEQLQKEQKLDFGMFDLVIVATGKVNTNFLINDYFIQHHPGLPVIFTWLDPYGIGGHTLVTNNQAAGCYRCLYPSKEIGHYNEASFAKHGQSFTKSIGGCNTRFTPFSGLDAIKAAERTVRTAIDILQGKIKGNPLYSWKGDASAFLDAGLKLARRFQFSSEELFEQCYDYHKQQCPACGGNGNAHIFPDERRAA